MTKLLTLDETAAQLGICTRTLREFVRKGRLPCILTGHGLKRQHRMFHPDDLRVFVDEQRRIECPPIAHKAVRTRTTGSRPKVIDFTARQSARRSEKAWVRGLVKRSPRPDQLTTENDG